MEYLIEVFVGAFVFGVIMFFWFQNYQISTLKMRLDYTEELAQTILELTQHIRNASQIQRELIDAQTDMIEAQSNVIKNHWATIEILNNQVDLSKRKEEDFSNRIWVLEMIVKNLAKVEEKA